LHRAVRSWPIFDRRVIGDQLVSAAHSVGANLAEAAGRWHRPDQRQFIYYARGSAMETAHWLARAEAAGLVDRSTRERWDEVVRTTHGLARALRTKN
jgi:four helix bundle protein